MTYYQIRLVKRLLALSFLCFGSVVATQLYLSLTKEQSSFGTSVSETNDPLTRQVELTRLDSEGRKSFVLRAAESVGRTEKTQTFRNVEIQFAAGKEQIPLVTTAETCEYDTNSSAVHLEGNVVIRDENTLRIETSVLVFRRAPNRVWTEERVRFFRSGLDGEAGNLLYRVPAEIINLAGGVTMTLAGKEGPPVEIESMTAVMRRPAKLIRFIDEVIVKQARHRLTCNDLQVYLTEDESGVEHIEAYENVDLLIVAAEPVADPEERATPRFVEQPGDKRLSTRKLEVFYAEDTGVLERARAPRGGTLVLEPRRGSREDSPFVRELQGNVLVFDFDSQGRLSELSGRQGITMTMRSLDGREEEKKLTAGRFTATFDSETEDLREAEFRRQVQFSQGELQAVAERVSYEAASGLLTLTSEPRLWNKRTTLEAETIHVSTATGDLEAVGKVRATLNTDPRSGEKGLFPASTVPADSADPEPVYFVAKHLRYERATDLAVFTGTARGFQGANQIVADQIELNQNRGELEATGSVRTVMHQSDVERDTPLRVQAGRLIYRSEEKVLHYRNKVVMNADGLTLKGQRIDVRLGQSGSGVEEIRATGNIEIQTADGRASGDEARYLPKKEEIHVIGEKAVLQNGDKRTEGKELTFFLSSDKIFIDGQQQSRTRTVYTLKPRLD